MAKAEELRAGLGFRPQFCADLFADRAAVDMIEVVADHYLDASPEKLAELDLLADHFPVAPHGLDLSLGSEEGVDPVYLRKMARLVARLDPPWWSEHLAFTRAGGVSIGHLAVLPYTQEAAEAAARNVETVRRAITAPLILENPTAIALVPGAEMDEPAFLTRVLEMTGCGWLCDVTNLYTNAINHGVDLEAQIDHWPWERVVQFHIAGGRRSRGLLMDSHDAPAPPEIWALLEKILPLARNARAIVLERDENLPPFGDLLAEVARAREIGRRCR
ncbi:DUF692 domain-containing protein [Methylosinus sp. H3A]|uniref:DUF692 domain-containing protein n=1 Tax=Methylosinus sp. H3A TaxID=2785786 RepID=UPI0018C23820|nr:DUF692 domain-containing protein [Methylosinus sp. H3A]MBG0808549.1 DUF692 domain-containing protein [Methylosinus sp. H3A]